MRVPETSSAPARPALVALEARSPAHRRPTSTARDAAPLVLAALSVLFLVLAVRGTSLENLGGIGLAGVLSPWAWVALALAVAACVTELLGPRPRTPVLVGLTALLILVSTGLPSLVEPAARLATSWTHSGFVDAIAGAGQVPLGVDSRFSWPGFFGHWAWIVDASGGLSLDGVLRWTPPVVVAVWAVGIHAIARPVLGGTRAPWAAVWLFLGVNWIEQDYFSPQATAVVAGLAVLACLLGPLATTRGDPAGGRWPLPAPGTAPRPWPLRALVAARTPVRRPDGDAGRTLLLWSTAAVCLAGIVVMHPLTPFAVIAMLTTLALAGRFWGRWLVVVLVVAEATWFVLGAGDFWTSRLALAVGAVGDVDATLLSSLFGRLVGDPGQIVVKIGRIAMAAATAGLAFAGAWLRWRRDAEWYLLPVAVVPAGLALAQTYGGEILLRVMLYALPIMAVLGVEALRAIARRRGGRGVLAVGMALLFAVLVILRGGNEAYVVVTPRQVAVVREVLAELPRGAHLLRLTDQGPVRVDRVADTVQVPSTPGCAPIAVDVDRCLIQERPDVLVVLPSMEAEGVELRGFAPGWSRAVADRLVANRTYRVDRDEDGVLVLVRIVPR